MALSYTSVILAKSNNQSGEALQKNITRSLLPVANHSLIAEIILKYYSRNGLTIMASSEAEYGFIASTAKSILGSSPYLVLPIKQDTKGALATLGWTLSNLPKNCPILVAPSDSLVLCDIDDFVRKMDKLQTDCGIIVFSSSNPEYSYVRTLKETVTEIAEKVIISNKASAGVYYFKDSDILCKCLEWAILNRITTDGNYYLAPALNYLVSEGKLVSTLEINTSEYLRFRTEEEFIESLTRMEGKYENDQY